MATETAVINFDTNFLISGPDSIAAFESASGVPGEEDSNDFSYAAAKRVVSDDDLDEDDEEDEDEDEDDEDLEDDEDEDVEEDDDEFEDDDEDEEDDDDEDEEEDEDDADELRVATRR